MPDSAKAPLSPGDQIDFAVPGTPATVTVHRTDNGRTGATFLTYVAQGAHRPDGWTYTYTDETVARFEATRAAHLLRHYGTADAIERRRAELGAIVREQENRQLRRMHNRALLDAARAELDTLLTFADAQMLIRLRADLDRVYAA